MKAPKNITNENSYNLPGYFKAYQIYKCVIELFINQLGSLV